MEFVPESNDGLPPICGYDELILKHAGIHQDAFRSAGKIDFGQIRSAAAIGLHMHQPLIPAGGYDLRTARMISNLKHMQDNPDVGDNHNAPVFYSCYKRMGEIVPRLVAEGKQPRVMLEYSGCLFYGLKQMGADDLFQPAFRMDTCATT